MGFLLSLGRKTRAQRKSSCSAHVGFVSSVSDQYFDSPLFDGWSNVLDGLFAARASHSPAAAVGTLSLQQPYRCRQECTESARVQ